MPFSAAQRRLVAAALCTPASVAKSASTEATISGRSSVVAMLIRIVTQQHYRGVRRSAPWLLVATSGRSRVYLTAMILLAVDGRSALRRLFAYRVIGAALVAPDECRDLSRDTDRRPADQFPCAGDPDQEADDHQHRDRVHRARIAPVSDHGYSLDQLDHERYGQPDQEHRMTQCVPPPPLTQADQRQQRRRDERDPADRRGHRGRSDLM